MRAMLPLALLTVGGCFTKPDPPSGFRLDAATGVDAPISGIVYLRGASLARLANSAEVLVDPAPPPSSTIVVAVGTYQTGTAQITDTAGNQYDVGTTVMTPAGSTINVAYAVNAMTSMPFRVTASNPSASEVTLAVHVYSGIAAATESLGRTGTSIDPGSGPLQVTVDGTLVFAVVSHDTDVTTAAGPSFTLRQVPTESPVMVPMATEDAIVARGSVSGSFRLSASSTWGCIGAAFRPGP